MAADYDQPKDVEKRVRFFDNQYLKDQDFIDEQHYHIDRQRRHNRTLHVAGIAEGLDVTPITGKPQVIVSPGTAIDADGRQVVLLTEPAAERTVDLVDNLNSTVNLYLTYQELESEPQESGGEGNRRWLERPRFSVIDIKTETDVDTTIPPLLLARIELDGSEVIEVDLSVRRYSGLRLPGPPSEDTPVLRAMASGRGARLTGSLMVDGNVGIGMVSPGEGTVGIGTDYKLKVESGNTYLGGDLTITGKITEAGGNPLFIVGDTKHGDTIPLPPGTSTEDWCIFLSPVYFPPPNVTTTSNLRSFSIESKAQPVQDGSEPKSNPKSGWNVICQCTWKGSAGNDTTYGKANYFLLSGSMAVDRRDSQLKSQK